VQYFAVMPSNVYGPGDNYDLETSHVLPALIRKITEAKLRNEPSVTVWGTGTPRREFIYSDDVADSCVFLMTQRDDVFKGILNDHKYAPLINVGCGQDITIRELVEVIRSVASYEGEIVWDRTKPDGTPRKLLDVSRLTALGWTARISLEGGIRRVQEDFMQRR
jgi:GDP-L-fucose synthase